MTKAHLSACPGCARHVRVSETACPFCGKTLGEAFRARPAPRPIRGRLGRAALYALGAGTITIAGACSSSSDSGGGVDAGGEDSGLDAFPLEDAAYGGPPIDGIAPAYGGPPRDGSLDAPIVDAAYGGPPIDASDAGDAGDG